MPWNPSRSCRATRPGAWCRPFRRRPAVRAICRSRGAAFADRTRCCPRRRGRKRRARIRSSRTACPGKCRRTELCACGRTRSRRSFPECRACRIRRGSGFRRHGAIAAAAVSRESSSSASTHSITVRCLCARPPWISASRKLLYASSSCTYFPTTAMRTSPCGFRMRSSSSSHALMSRSCASRWSDSQNLVVKPFVGQRHRDGVNRVHVRAWKSRAIPACCRTARFSFSNPAARCGRCGKAANRAEFRWKAVPSRNVAWAWFSIRRRWE